MTRFALLLEQRFVVVSCQSPTTDGRRSAHFRTFQFRGFDRRLQAALVRTGNLADLALDALRHGVFLLCDFCGKLAGSCALTQESPPPYRTNRHYATSLLRKRPKIHSQFLSKFLKASYMRLGKPFIPASELGRRKSRPKDAHPASRRLFAPSTRI